MIQLGINGKEYPLKSKWNELSKEDLLEICRIQLLDLDEPYKRLMIFKYLMGVDFQVIETLNPLALPEIMGLLNYLFKESHLTINHFPEIGTMKGPEPGLTNFTFEQFFGYSEAYYYLVLKGASPDDLINTMYNYNGNDENKNQLIGLSAPEKLAIFFYYQGCTSFIKLKFKSVFSSAENKTPDGLEFTRLVNQLNNNDISRNEQIKSTNLYEALVHLQTIIDGKSS
jgi:hypothetical protein